MLERQYVTIDNSLSALRGNPGHRCPWWLGWALASPLRRLVEKPEKLLAGLIAPGSQVLEVGPGMGFFTMYLAEQVGTGGRVHCVDVEERMLRALGRRIRRRGFDQRVSLRQCGPTALGISDLCRTIDSAVLIHVLHELPDPCAALQEIAATLKPGGRLVLIEPPGHVDGQQFDLELALARRAGLVPVESPALSNIRPRLAAVLARNGG